LTPARLDIRPLAGTLADSGVIKPAFLERRLWAAADDFGDGEH
jgi:hypothetical protein